MKKRFLVVAAIIIGSRLPAQQDSTTISLEEVTLTTNKFPRKQNESGKVLIIIPRSVLEKSGGKNLGEILNTVAGTTVIGANNTPGTNLTVSLRGASAGNTLILLDGIPVNDPSVITNYFDLNFISIDQVERIEILKGGQSTLYGSDAVAGVINIISKSGANKKLELSGAVEAGSYNTTKQSIGISGRYARVNYIANYTHLNSSGFSAAYDSTGNGNFDKDGISQHVASARIGFQFSPRFSANIFGLYSTYVAELDYAAFNDDRDYEVKNRNIQPGAGFKYIHKLGEMHLNYRYNSSERIYTNDSAHKTNPFAYYAKSKYEGGSHFAELYNNWKWSSWHH